MQELFGPIRNPQIDHALNLMDTHLKISGRADKTRRNYMRALSKFMRETNTLPENCTRKTIIEFFYSLNKSNPNSHSKIRIYIAAITYYFVQILNKAELVKNLPRPRKPKNKIDILSAAEVCKLLKKCKNAREKLIVSLLYETGMRVSELVKLRLEDFDFFNNCITIRNSKNDNNRTVHFGESLSQIVQHYLGDYPSLFSGTILFKLHHPFMPLSIRGVRWTLKRLAIRSDIHKPVNPHAFRHAFAVHYINFGGAIYQLQRLLGHNRMSNTFAYLQYAVLPETHRISPLDVILTHNPSFSPAVSN